MMVIKYLRSVDKGEKSFSFHACEAGRGDLRAELYAVALPPEMMPLVLFRPFLKKLHHFANLRRAGFVREITNLWVHGETLPRIC
jgi:hypothetical protein